MNQTLSGKTAFITGSASGIGLEIAKTFAQEGANVVISDLNAEKSGQAASELKDQGWKAMAAPCDVTDEEAYKHSLQSAQEAFGRVDILINNAGLQHVAPIEDFPTETFERLVKVMLTAPFIGIKHVFPLMKKQGFGRIINMASINGVIGFAGKAAYNSAKHGVIGLTKVAALEGAQHGITVNALCPGYVDTPLVRGQLGDLAKTRNVSLDEAIEEVLLPLVPQKRLLTVGEIADYAVFLASDKARGVTGQAVILDGGYTAQ
ncbi:3-hydroxybutyrate dehydrogenase [Bacillus badius]|uniref:D-beta-hydroxybutyrate dehydrogenase n=1 Tax=Bacillus badius TaxID=1455 RepID=A0ABR5AU68_BACBA|nr:3-hydroxybutyrate dehydrogenase [Bacillus badius]KIL76754.1 D-beta-hydroxybutyrate dehydrogenase [Bacillus badius]KIL78312.1 D-beta-hydroxybutyrate dehydrogenase [Bacillus badius]KZR57747.1 3-hydroxybutyrate dehydrogenase [Bacillus badius]MED4715843.1 3-hydroxybutyrate dehydrogenase [Bacillus badius]